MELSPLELKEYKKIDVIGGGTSSSILLVLESGINYVKKSSKHKKI